MKSLFYTITIGLIFMAQASAGELNWSFKSPAFHYGNGYSTHVLSVEQLQFNRKKELQEKAEAAQREAEREAENTTLAKFLKNVESRIYATLSKQLVDNMFATCDSTVVTCPTTGSAEIDGANIYWIKDTTAETITIQITQADGSYTELTVPIGDFNF
jgi:hypothetical protein